MASCKDFRSFLFLRYIPDIQFVALLLFVITLDVLPQVYEFSHVNSLIQLL